MNELFGYAYIFFTVTFALMLVGQTIAGRKIGVSTYTILLLLSIIFGAGMYLVVT